MTDSETGVEMPQETLVMTLLMTPDMANFAGNVHGGLILKLLDQVAYTCASRFTRQYMVTASVDQVRFWAPIQIGELVTFAASVNYSGRSSLEVGIRVDTENVSTGVVRHTNSCYFTMVAISRGRPCEVRQHTPKSPEQIRRWSEAALRRGRRSTPALQGSGCSCSPESAGIAEP